MKTSEIINLLIEIKNKYGDKDFWIFNDTFGDHKVNCIKIGKNKLGDEVVYFDHDDKENGLDIEYTLNDLTIKKKAS